MDILGKTNEHFSWPVCDKFEPTIHAGRLCYSLNIESLEEKVEMKEGPSNGLTFVMDYNEGKMVKEGDEVNKKKKKRGLHQMHHTGGSNSEALIFLDTLGTIDLSKIV